MTETQQRFLRAIAERVPRDQVVEVHLFPPIRQGGVETGVAVVAEDPRAPAAPQADGAPDAHAEHEKSDGMSVGDAVGSFDGEASVEEPVVDLTAPADFADADDDDVVDAETVVEAAAVDAPAADEASASPAPRFTIHTARYRLTLKGVDRGKWDFDVVAEADAPLHAVDAVVRGVQRRAGEGTEPDRLTTETFRDALEAPLAQLER